MAIPLIRRSWETSFGKAFLQGLQMNQRNQQFQLQHEMAKRRFALSVQQHKDSKSIQNDRLGLDLLEFQAKYGGAREQTDNLLSEEGKNIEAGAGRLGPEEITALGTKTEVREREMPLLGANTANPDNAPGTWFGRAVRAMKSTVAQPQRGGFEMTDQTGVGPDPTGRELGNPNFSNKLGQGDPVYQANLAHAMVKGQGTDKNFYIARDGTYNWLNDEQAASLEQQGVSKFRMNNLGIDVYTYSPRSDRVNLITGTARLYTQAKQDAARAKSAGNIQ